MASSSPSPSKQPIWQQLALGGSSCAIATTFTHPIDTVKLRLQLQGAYATESARYSGLFSGLARVTRDEGVSALYLGISPAILRAATYSATRLGMYEPLRTFFKEQARQQNPTFATKVSAAVCSGVLGAFVGNPCELVKVRMQQGKDHRYAHVIDGIVRITREEGFFALWTGTTPAALRAALLTSSQLATYDQCARAETCGFGTQPREDADLVCHIRCDDHSYETIPNPPSKVMLKHYTGLKEGLPAHLGAAMTAGLVTTTVSTPADLVKSVVMNSKPRLQILECVRYIFNKEGIRGFMRGWTANYARLGPHTLITVVTYENLRTALGWDNL